jgi:PKD repeat protein
MEVVFMRKTLFVLGTIFFYLTTIVAPHSCTNSAGDSTVSWECILYCNETSGRIDSVTIGEAPDANDGSPADDFDVVKPPTPITPYVRAYLSDNLPSPYNTLWEDFRQYPDTYKVWNLSIQWVPTDSTSPSDIIIRWNPTLIDDSEYTTMYLCTNAGTPLKNMRTENSYTFPCPAYIPQNFKIIGSRNNSPPGPPSIPSGETTGYHGTTYTYTTSCLDSDADDVYYQFDWGDDTLSSWLGPYPSGQIIYASYVWHTPGTYPVKAHTKDVYGQQGMWSSTLSVEMQNRAPGQPTNPFPQNGASNVPTSPTFTWIGTDPDGDLITYTVYLGITNPPVKLVDNQSSSSFHPGTLLNQTMYYWRIISWDNFGGSTSGPVWSFHTQSSDGGSEPPDDNTNVTNQLPVADVSLSEQSGFVGTLMIFNGSRSYDLDGYLTKWSWDFGDGTNGTGERTSHAYHALGIYTVTLTVTDDSGSTGTDTISVEVGTANWPPTKPIINGTRTGTKNRTYTYTVYATDADSDFIQYIINWGDGKQNISMLLPNGTTWSLSHSWNTPGKYQIIAKATDNTTFSEQTTFQVFIDVSFITTIGFLFDTNNDGQFDSFYINDTGDITGVQRLNDGGYYLDTDNDGKWNYLYNPSSGSLTPLSTGVTTIENQWFFILIIAIAVIIIACIVYMYKKNYF